MSPRHRAEDLRLSVRWPTEAEALASRWFSPLAVGNLRLADRTWVPAMVPWRATEDGQVTPQVLQWYERLAQGQPGALVVEATGIRDVRSGPLLRISDDRFLPGLEQLVERVKSASDGHTQVFIQLIDFLTVRRRPAREKYLLRYLLVDDALRQSTARLLDDAAIASSADDDFRRRLLTLTNEQLRGVLRPAQWRDLQFGYRETVNDTHLAHIAELPQALPPLFADAAARAQRAGFDGVELHYAHAYTMASFLSATNGRADGYGGDRTGRLRLPLEVLDAVRGAVGPDYVVGARFLGDEVIEGGSRVEDAVFYGVSFARAGMDFLSVSKGGKFDDAKQPRVGEAVYPYTGPSGHECMPTVYIGPPGPFGRNTALAGEIRRAVRVAGYETPVVTAGGICSFTQAEEILEKGEADIVAAARQTLADPDWFRKVRMGRGEEVRRCLFTNYCESLDQRHKEVTCQLWDRPEASDPAEERTRDGRRRLVPPGWSSAT